MTRISVGLVVLLLGACAPQHGALVVRPVDSAALARDPVLAASHRHRPEWLKLNGVIATGTTHRDGKPAILVFVRTLTDSLRAQLPDSVEGYAVIIQESTPKK